MTYDLIIAGGGPAGITAGIYASRQKLNTLLITKNFGGQLARKTVHIKNYPGFGEVSGLELIQKFEKHLRVQHIEIKMGDIENIKKDGDLFLVSMKDGQHFGSKSVLIATGADPRPLSVPGEKEFIGRGVSYCTACDGPVFKDKTIAVVGGGDAGFEAAIFLTNYAKKIYILERSAEVRAKEEIQDEARSTGKIEVLLNATLKKLEGDNFLKAAVFEDSSVSQEKRLEIQGIFVETGSQPATSFIKDLVDFNEKGEIISGTFGETKTPGLFAAGDVTDIPYKQVVIAAGSGSKAVFAIYNYLKNSGKLGE